MKIDRLIGILSVLLQEETVTAPELAERFEVSRRTINRDIDDLLYAGIPIRTTQGVGGGISIADGYKMDRTILTSKDMQMILAGLRSLDSVSGSSYYSQLMEKIQTGSSEFISGRDSILIDLSSWYRDSLAPKISTIQDAIEKRHLVAFTYYGPKGESNRKIDKVIESKEEFTCRDALVPELGSELKTSRDIILKALFEPDMKWRLVEEFGSDCCEVQEDGRLLLIRNYADMNNLTMWMLTFGDKAEVIEPKEVREKLKAIAGSMIERYGGK